MRHVRGAPRLKQTVSLLLSGDLSESFSYRVMLMLVLALSPHVDVGVSIEHPGQ